MTTGMAILLIAAALLAHADAKSNLLRAQNVFGWQDKSIKHKHSTRARYKSAASPYTQSPLKRSENVFNWQQQQQQQRHHPASPTRIVNVSSKSTEQPNPLNIIQPRKKELWLPWPLGELRNDYHRFAEQQRHRSVQSQQHQQQRIRDYYSDDYNLHHNNRIIRQGKDWAGKLLQRGQSLTQNFRRHDDAMKTADYWVKDTTTPMATASANMKEEKHKGKRKIRGGDTKEEKKWDHEMIFRYVKLQMKVRMRQLGYVGSDFSVHLPPASPTLLLLYILPSTQDPLRRLVKFSLTGATISWMHSEATKYRRFAPLPTMKGMNVRRPDLLPFLPEELKLTEVIDEVAPKEKPEIMSHTNNTHTLWDPFQSFGTISSAYRSWLEGNNIRDRRSHTQRRVATQSRLLELADSMNSTDASENSYALITGASRGIGRALAVELARYRIPLILVARDIAKLTEVAQDIEKYYNVPCRVLQADLSSPDSASRIHAATTEAGLKVDILVNNAGVCTQGEMVECETDDTLSMIQVNIGSVVRLSQLYGKDMKERRRGRMLFVSSMAGAMPGCASVGVYAATKSFEKSLAASLGREMERFGVGVTCMLPGAVKDTDFASRSDVESAVCFQVPGYAKTPELVAGEGVKAMMLGYPEVYPGWENKFFSKLLPHIPARVAGLIGEYAWSPWSLGMLPNHNMNDTEEASQITPTAPSHSWKFRRPPGNVLRLPELPKIQMPKVKQQEDILLSDISKDTAKLNETYDDTNTFKIPDVAQSNNITEKLLPPVGEPPNQPAPMLQQESQPDAETGEVDALTNETWYPSMLDQRQYDFRDRRLDY